MSDFSLLMTQSMDTLFGVFGEPSTYQRGGGTIDRPIPAVTVWCVRKDPRELEIDTHFLVLEVRTSELPGTANSGDTITLGGVSYRVVDVNRPQQFPDIAYVVAER